MSDLRPDRVRRLRSDAIRSRAALVDAAIRVLAVDPDADLAAVARSAGLTRQTLYAHFGSRAGLLHAVVERITAEALRLLEEAALDHGSARDAVRRFIGLFDELPEGWTSVATAAAAGASAPETSRLHEPLTDSLIGVIRRGQTDGEFAADQPAEWLAHATIALGHAAYELGSSGFLAQEVAREGLVVSLLRLYGADDVAPSSSPPPA